VGYRRGKDIVVVTTGVVHEPSCSVNASVIASVAGLGIVLTGDRSRCLSVDGGSQFMKSDQRGGA